MKDTRIVDLQRRGIQSGARMVPTEIFYNKVSLKYKRDKAHDIDTRRGQKECPPASLQLDVT